MKRWMTLGLMALGLGCDAQAGDQYRGEPLFTMTGSVELALEVEDQDQLMPALAFRGDDHSEDPELFVIDADVQGRFPAEFTLNVYDAPPASAVQALDPEYGLEPRVAIGYITAVTPETPRVIRYAAHRSDGGSACFAASAEPCSMVSEWCNGDETVCYTETTTCPAADSPPEECTVVASGDPALKKDRFSELAGLSENYMVLWLEEAAPPRTWIAYAVGKRDEGLAQGYHLLRFTEQAEPEGHAECMAEATLLAIDRLNERFGVHYNTEIELSEYCSELDDCGHDPTYMAYQALQTEAEIELDCGPNDTLITHIDDPAHERISVRIGDDLKAF